jgi:hypothetical protein
MTREKQTYVGINVQYPISDLIIRGLKTVETRNYPLPNKFRDIEMILVETPGADGKFKARMRGIVIFSECFQYQSEEAFNRDIDRHCVSPDSSWAWKPDQKKWGWLVRVKQVFERPLPSLTRRGILYTHDLTL